MNRHQKKVLTLAAGIANLSFSVAVATVGTYAWFAAYTNIAYKETTSATVTVTSNDMELEWEVLKWSDDDKAGLSYSTSDEFYLQQYDEYLPKKNIHTNAILKTVLDMEGITSASQIYVDITCEDGNEPEYGSACPSYTSNICQFKSTVYSYVDTDGIEHVLNTSIDATSANTRYNTATTYFANTSTPGTRFVALHNNTPNKRKNTITLCPAMDCGDDTVSQIVLYVECSYNEKLVSYFQNTNSFTGQIDLTGDITEFNFRSGAAVDGAFVKVTDSSALTSDGDYMITYDGFTSDGLSPALDGSGTTSSAYTSGQNYVDVFERKNMIKATEVTDDALFSYDTSRSKLTSSAGYVIGATSSSMGASTSGSYTNTLSYSDSNPVISSVDQSGKALEFNTTPGTTRFSYYTSGNQSAIDLYKYDADADYSSSVTGIFLQSGYKTAYYVGDSFVTPTVFAQLTDGTSYDVTSEATFSGFSTTTAGTRTVAVYFTDEDGGITYSTSYEYTVTAVTVTSIEVTTNPTKMAYEEGETFDPTGMVVTATYNNGDTAVINNDDLTYKTTALDSGDTPFEISYGGASTTIAITITYSNVYSFELVTSSSTAIAAGDEIIIACHNSDGSNYVLNNTVYNNYYLTANSVTLSSDLSTLTYDSGCTVWTVGGSSGAWTFYDGSNYLYTYTSTNGTRTYYDLGITSSVGDDAYWTTSIGTTYSTVLNNSYSRYIYHYINDAGTTMDFGMTSDAPINILIYRKTAQSPLSSISLSNAKTTFYVGDPYEAPTITANYADGSSRSLSASDCTITGHDTSTAGTYTVTVSYTETYADSSTITKTATYSITVTAVTLTSIDITTNPKDTSYYEGEYLDLTGMVVTAYYNNGSSVDVTSSVTTSPDTATALTTSDTTVTVSYKEGDITKTDTFTITVTAVTVSSIAVSGQTTSYTVGSTFSFDGTVTATYNSGKTVDVTNSAKVNSSSVNMSTAGTYTVTVSYTESGTTVSTTYEITVSGSSKAEYGQTTAITTTLTAIGGDSNVKIKTSKANSYTSPLRIYANTTITIQAESGYELVSVTYVASSLGNYVTYAQNATVTPSVKPTVSEKNITWTFTTSPTKFTFKPSGQTRATNIIVVYKTS